MWQFVTGNVAIGRERDSRSVAGLGCGVCSGLRRPSLGEFQARVRRLGSVHAGRRPFAEPAPESLHAVAIGRCKRES